MAYADEDEIDWSDGSFGDLLRKPVEAAACPIQPSQSVENRHDQGLLFALDVHDQDRIPSGVPLESASTDDQGTSHALGRRVRGHLNRRLPSKEDYKNYTLYQASQKAYEATFLNTFIAHALHPDRIAQCTENPASHLPTVVEYMQSVSHEVNGITRKMIRNAHCRTVHLLARDGNDGAPFLDVYAFDSSFFSNYGPSNIFPVAKRLNNSWHRTSPDPLMVQYSTKEYELGYQSGPLEEIDDFISTVFRNINRNGVLPAGRPIGLSTSRKRKGQNMPGAAMRRDRTNLPRGNWLSFAQLDSTSDNHLPQSPVTNTPSDIIHRADLDGVCVGTPINSIEHAEKAHPWRMRLINDHKRRLTRNWGKPSQALDFAVQSFKQAVAAAMSMGIRPTAHNYHKKFKTVIAREHHPERVRHYDQVQNKSGSVSSNGSMPESHLWYKRLADPSTLIESILQHEASIELPKLVSSTRPNKKRKRDPAEQASAKSSTKQQTKASRSCRRSVTRSNRTSLSAQQPPSLRQNQLKILEFSQHLPPNAYSEPILENEKPVWRCAFKHAMGHYYNAGDRKSCRGCNTSLTDNISIALMDFYMPSRTFFFQPAPEMCWKPSKQSTQPRKSDRPCHNSVAKDAYWAATNAGASEEEARQMGVDAVIEYIKPKPPPRAPTPEPAPEPKPNLGPHPSGSATMEHGQDIPDRHYWEQLKAEEDYAWRCDVNHGLGRYYLAGDKKSCPGCGSSRNGPGKHEEMDFYLPPGIIVRQEAPGLSEYKPRKPYRTSKSTVTKRDLVTHNQMCSKIYFELVEEGCKTEEAIRLAVQRVDIDLDKKRERKLKRQEECDEFEDLAAVRKRSTSSSAPRKDSLDSYFAFGASNSAKTSQAGTKRTQYRRNSRGGCTMALVPNKRSANYLSEAEPDDPTTNRNTRDTPSEQDPWDSIHSSSAGEDSSASETE
ncbi:hypothetical protein G6011_10464 [Alternaria panax]|uniref:Uncharacterized protein n=1 Tax=Alternaria panax TaxID=48097 RepID=A0AAD4IBW3_9PLEO|nr:hypothetical protein G6011_10464 [Alternaria panax]